MRFALVANRRETQVLALATAVVLFIGLCGPGSLLAETEEKTESSTTDPASTDLYGGGGPVSKVDDPFADYSAGAALGASSPRSLAASIPVNFKTPVKRILDEQTKFAFIDTPLEEVVSYLEQLHNMKIVLDEQRLNDAGITKDTPITMNVEGFTLAEALDIMAINFDLQYQDRGSWLLFTSEAGLDKWISNQLSLETRISYNRVPLAEAIAGLGRIHQIPFDIDINTVLASSAFKTGTVTMQRDGVTLSEALTQILAEHDLRYERRQNRLWITRIPAKDN